MLCENCQQKEATVYVSGMVNGQKTEHYLCDECVKLNQKDTGTHDIIFNNFLSELMKIALEEGYLQSSKTPIQRICEHCGLSLKEFLQIGRFGCKTCYTTFNQELKNAFTNIHGNTKHVGKVIESQQDVNIQLNELQDALEKAIKDEAYEEAARLRDLIRALKKEGNE